MLTYGSILLQNILSYLAHLNYHIVLIIPGPMEMINGKLELVEGAEKEVHFPKLIRFYQKNGFVTDPYRDTQMVHYLKKEVPETSYKPHLVLAVTGGVAVLLYILLRKLYLRWKKSP